MNKNLIRLTTCLSFVASISLSSCNSNVVKSNLDTQQDQANSETQPLFKAEADQTKFSISENIGKVIFGGDISFKNLSGYTISDINTRHASLEIDYADGRSINFDMAIISSRKKWRNNATATITVGIDPFQSDLQYLEVDDFQRTPSKIFLNLSLTAINIDKEIPFQYQADVLPQWKSFQTKKGLR